MNAHRLCSLAAAAVASVFLVGLAVAGASAQSAPYDGSTTLDRIVSPRVVSTYVIRGPRIALLVLWRGTPGWFKKGSADTPASTAAGGFYEQAFTITDGGLNLKVDINHTDGTARI